MQQGKRIIAGGLLVLLMLGLMPALSQADTAAAVSYLKDQSLDDWSAQALVAAGETVSDLSSFDDFQPQSATDVARRILTLVALQQDPAKFYPTLNLVKELQTTYYQQQQIGSADLLNDDIFGILALASVRQTDSLVLQDAAVYLLNHQNDDGGWSWSTTGDSDTNDTAAAIMALLEVGLTTDSPAISKALAYLNSTQNSDGGWPYSPGGESDSASTAWVISTFTKAGISVPAEAIDFLLSLQTVDGSFKWVASDASGSKLMTSFAVIALQQSYFPVKKLPLLGNLLRIEGSQQTYCHNYFQADTALSIVEIAAPVCNYTYEIEDTAYGPYLKRIGSDEAAGSEGWMYRVNWQMPPVGAADYQLKPTDQVLWYFGEWTVEPLRLLVNSQWLNQGDVLQVKVEVWSDDRQDFKPAAGVVIEGLDQTYTTDDQGRFSLTMDRSGTYTIWAEQPGKVRSNKVEVVVGNLLTDSVAWQVEIVNQEVPAVSFAVLTEQIDFGSLGRGEMASREIILQNNGQELLYVEAVVKGEPELISNFYLNGDSWYSYNQLLPAQQEDSVIAQLTIPPTYQSQGSKGGDIIFWAVTAN